MLCTPHGMAIQLQLPERRLRRMAEAGQIPSITLPDGSLRFDAAHVRQWLRRMERQPVMMVSGERA
jgi:hypothetical protein